MLMPKRPSKEFPISFSFPAHKEKIQIRHTRVLRSGGEDNEVYNQEQRVHSQEEERISHRIKCI
jgi:hypothetical protein